MMDPILQAVLQAIRKIIRASDVHSNHIRRHAGLTVPQLLLLQAIQRSSSATAGELSEQICLSQATTTNILDRLEAEGLAERRRSDRDRRKVHVRLTEKGELTLSTAPSPMDAGFIEQFSGLKPHEQSAILSALQQVDDMMQSSTAGMERSSA